MINIGYFLALLAGVYLVVVALAWGFQDRLVFFPSSEITATPADIGLDFEEVRMETEDGVSIHGWFLPGPEGSGGPTVLFSHGNAGNISQRLEWLRIVHELGLACLVVDYRGYGKSGGRPSEKGLYRDSRAAWNWLLDEKGLKEEEILVWGHSLGGAVAAGLAMETSPGALIVESAFTSLPEMGQKAYPFLPVRLISNMRFPTEKYISQVDCPVLVVHSPGDETVPYEFGHRLYRSAPEPKSFLGISGGHNEGFLVSGEKYVAGIREFIDGAGLK
ncbi:MAG: alpha/beta hydrolase [Desulfurivibrionaceae bacterium]